MPTIEEVQAQLRNLDNCSKLASFREIRELPNILGEGEKIEKMIQGNYGESSSIGVLVATNRRLVVVDKGLIYGVRVEDFSYDRISPMEYRTGLVMGKIIMYAAGNKAEIQYCDKEHVQSFVEHARARTTGVTKSASAPNPQSEPPQPDFISQLERLGKLRDRGVLTEEEFQAQKRRLLG